MTKSILQVTDLQVQFRSADETVTAVSGVTFHVREGETLGIVGESGCGKSVTSLAIMQLLAANGQIRQGTVELEGTNLLTLSSEQMRDIRGNQMSMIFQEPMTSLNPIFTIGKQIDEAILLHQNVNKKEARARTIEILRKVGIPRAEQIVNEHPHQLSGGMRQRVMIAMALVCNPRLLIADEPTTALDVTIQAQILELMSRLKDETGTAILLITHDLGVVAEMCDRVVVMYAGQIVEESAVVELFQHPKHPYTVGLMGSIPQLDKKAARLTSIPGTVPGLSQMPQGCRFAPRCTHTMDICLEKNPDLIEVSKGHRCRCWLHEEGSKGGDLQ